MQRVREILAWKLRLGGIRRHACMQLRRLITRRSQVQILPPLLERPFAKRGLLFSVVTRAAKLCTHFCTHFRFKSFDSRRFASRPCLQSWQRKASPSMFVNLLERGLASVSGADGPTIALSELARP